MWLRSCFSRAPVRLQTNTGGAGFVVFIFVDLFRLGDEWIYASGMLLASFTTHGPIGWAMAMDMLPNPADQAKFFPILHAVMGGTLSSIVGDGLSWVVLHMHLVDYLWVWVILTASALVVLVMVRYLIPETMANPKSWPGFCVFLREITPGLSGTTSYTRAWSLWFVGSGQSAISSGKTFHALGSGRQDTTDGLIIRRNQREAAQLRALRVIILGTIIGGFAGGVGTFGDSFLLGPLHFRQ